MKNIFFITLSILITSTSISQDIDIFKPKDKSGYKIEGYVNGLQDTSIILFLLFWWKTIFDTAYSKMEVLHFQEKSFFLVVCI